MKPDVSLAEQTRRPFLVCPAPAARPRNVLANAQHYLARCARASELLAIPDLSKWYAVGAAALRLWRIEQRLNRNQSALRRSTR